MLPRDRNRWLTVSVGTLVFGGVLGLWTVRAAWPQRDDLLRAGEDVYLPISGGHLFTLTGGPGGVYALEADLACDAREVVVGTSFACDGRRFSVVADGDRHRLVLDGVVAKAGQVVGSGRDADVVWPLPGLGVAAIRLQPLDACPEDPFTPNAIACVESGGAPGAVLVDRAARVDPKSPPAQIRVGLDHGARQRVGAGDRLWLGPIPVDLAADDVADGIRLTVPRDRLSTLSGDRRWMSLELPSWPLGHDDAEKPEVIRAWSREVLYASSPNPAAWRVHLETWRIEHEQEEKLQAFVDHQLLCYAPTTHALVWNLASPNGCDGAPMPIPPAGLVRDAEQAAYQPGTARLLRVTEDALAGLPDETPDPAGLVFVFDWAWEDGPATIDRPTDEGPAGGPGRALRRVPVRLLGVRPDSTRNGPPRVDTPVLGDGACALAMASAGRAPIDLVGGSTSPWLEVLAGDGLVPGSALLLPDDGALCAWEGDSKPPGEALEPPTTGGKPRPPEVLTLGTVHARAARGKRAAAASWGPTVDNALPSGASGACARLAPVDGGFALTVPAGDRARVLVDGAPAADGAVVADGKALAVGSLSVVLHAPTRADRAAESVVHDGVVARVYPFGAALAPVIGLGPLAGGVEGAAAPTVWEEATSRWRLSACTPGADDHGVDLTIRGDLQRIVDAEIRGWATEDVTASAVLLDGATGDVLAVGNAPSFDPADAEALQRLRSRLRVAGPGGNVRVDALENRAFLRARHVGSAHKLLTSYALARTGRLAGADDPAAPDVGCGRFTTYGSRDVDGTLRLGPDADPGGPRSQPCGHGPAYLADPGRGFHDAFRKSINLYFGVGAFALAPGSGVDYTRPRPAGLVGDPLHDPTKGSGGLFLAGPDLGLVTASTFDPRTAFSPAKNALVRAMVDVGVRFHYLRAGGGGLETQRVDGVDDVTFPTATTPWLPGLQAGRAFRYPSVPGPEQYAVEGVPGWSVRPLSLAIRDEGAVRTATFDAATSSIREYGRTAYGMGGTEASALSLAAVATPMARPDGAAIAPQLLVHPAVAIVTPGVVAGGRDALTAAMRAVVAEPGSTAYSYFEPDIRERLGGKTGTFEIGVIRPDTGGSRASVERIVRWACGVRGATAGKDELAAFSAALDARTGRRAPRRWLADRPYARLGMAEVVANPPAAGFAAGAEACVDMGLVPGRARTSGVVAGVDAGAWLDAVVGAFPSGDGHEEKVEGSSFVAVVFDGLADAPPGGQPYGQGWVLAVVVDGHPTAAKRAAARILGRLRDYALATGQGVVTPPPTKEPT